jgi:hypothetical protein
MQTSPFIPTLKEFVWLALASVLGVGGSQWYTAWKNRRTPVATVHLNEAQADLARAQATQSLAETLAKVSEQQKEARAAIADFDARDLAHVERVALLELQLRQAGDQLHYMKSLLTANKIAWDEHLVK